MAEPHPAPGDTTLSPRRPLNWRLPTLLLFNLLLLAWLLLRPAPASLFTTVANLAYTLGPLAAAIWCFTRLRDPRPSAAGHSTASWICLTLGILGFVAGQAVWTFEEVVLHRRTPFPSLADVGFCAAYPFLFAGVALLPSRPIPLVARWRVLLDSLTTMAALVTFSWYFVLAPTLAQSHDSRLARVLAPFYPLCDLALLFCVLMLAGRGRAPGTGCAVACVAVGLLAIVAVDTTFAVQTLAGTYVTGSPIDLGWPLGYMLVGLGAWHVRTAVPSNPQSAIPNPQSPPLPTPSLLQSLLPYALIPPAIALLCFVYADGGTGPRVWGVYGSFGLLALLVLARQFFVVWENQGLYLRIRDAYDALEQGNRSLHAANQRLESLATTDGMTQLPNHRAFQDRLRADLATARRDGTPLSLLLIDVDHFKQYNDAFGHPAGDDVLRSVASLIRASVREAGLAARYGGEEFAVLLPRTDTPAACETAERIRRLVASHPFPNRAITLSIGVATADSADAEPAQLVARADQAMYAAKSGGRNRVMHASPLRTKAA